MKQIKFLAMALLIVPAMYLLVLGPRSDAPSPPGRVVVDYWEKWTADEERAMRVIVNDFNDTVGKDKNIFVRYVSTSNVDQKTLVATAGGVPPDIAGLWDYNLAQFAALDSLMPLDDLAAHADPPFTEKRYLPVYWNNCHYNGHLYALVSTPAAVALHYNKDAFREVGLDPDHPPQTLQELDADAEKMDKRDGGRLVRTGFLPTEPGWYVNDCYMWFGGHIWDEDHHKFTLTDPKVVAAFTWVQSYSKRLGKDAVNEFRGGVGNFDSPQNPFLSGTMAMTQQGPWMANYIINLNPALDGLAPGQTDDTSAPLPERRKRMHWQVAPFPSELPDGCTTMPSNLQNVTYCGFDTMVIPVGAKHPKEAFEFMSYVNRQDVMEKLCKAHSKNSPLQTVSEDFLQHHKNPYVDVFQNLAKSPNARGTPQIPVYAELDANVTVMVQRLALMDDQPAQALEELQERMQKIYDAFDVKQQARRALANR